MKKRRCAISMTSLEKDYWAVDIGANTIRLCRIKSGPDGGYELRDFYEENVAVHSSFADLYSVNEDELRRIQTFALTAFLEKAKVNKRHVVSTLADGGVFTRYRNVVVPKKLLERVVRYEIQQQIPFAVDEVTCDFQILGRSIESGSPGFDVLMAVVKTENAIKQAELLQLAGCRVRGLTPSIFPSYNWLKYCGQINSVDGPVALIEIGASHVSVIIESKGIPVFVRPLKVGGNNLTRAVFAQHAWITEIEADNDITPVLESLVTELKRTFKYFKSLPQGNQVKRAILTGGGSSMRNLAPYLAAKLGCQVVMADPLAGLNDVENFEGGKLSGNINSMTTILGLALSLHQNVTVDLNLLP